MKISPSFIAAYYICSRQLWFMSRQLQPDQDNPFLIIGRLIAGESYKKNKKEILVENMKIDLVKTEDKEIIVCEIKKSSKCEYAAKMQLCYYLLRLKQLGISATGELLFPKEKKKIHVELTPEIEDLLTQAQIQIEQIINNQNPPKPQKCRFCSKCAYREFCWA